MAYITRIALLRIFCGHTNDIIIRYKYFASYFFSLASNGVNPIVVTRAIAQNRCSNSNTNVVARCPDLTRILQVFVYRSGMLIFTFL